MDSACVYYSQAPRNESAKSHVCRMAAKGAKGIPS
jgi:hypothetical protein